MEDNEDPKQCEARAAFEEEWGPAFNFNQLRKARNLEFSVRKIHCDTIVSKYYSTPEWQALYEEEGNFFAWLEVTTCANTYNFPCLHECCDEGNADDEADDNCANHNGWCYHEDREDWVSFPWIDQNINCDVQEENETEEETEEQILNEIEEETEEQILNEIEEETEEQIVNEIEEETEEQIKNMMTF